MKTSGLFCLIMVVGCSQVETSEVEQASGTPCPPWLCLNSPELLLHGMHELNLFGVPNGQDMTLERYPGSDRAAIFSAGKVYELGVKDHRFYGEGPGGTLRGPELLDAELHVLQEGKRLYTMHITSVREMVFPVGDQDTLEVYKLAWSHPDGTFGDKTICNGGRVVEEGEVNGMLQDEVLVFTGDRIDPERLTIEQDREGAWINFGCTGNTIAKLHQTRNTSSSNRDPDPDGNQATLRMLAGDYCGKGVPITVSGTPLRWRGGWVKQYPISPGKLEARWTKDGAKCLNRLRLDATPSPDFPDPWDVLRATCQVPECNDDDPMDLGDADRVSALPL